MSPVPAQVRHPALGDDAALVLLDGRVRCAADVVRAAPARQAVPYRARSDDRLSEETALQNFLVNLKDHLLARITGRPYSGSEDAFSNEERARVRFMNNRIYRHKVIRINYTTYDMRRDQDSINPRTHADIMVLSQENENNAHPFCDALPGFIDGDPMAFLWVRWFGRDSTFKVGFSHRRLPRIGFVDQVDADAFGFVNPQDVIRTAHLIPAFAHGRTSRLLGPSIVRREEDKDEDWEYYYVGIFTDHDMFMRFCGGAVGHKGTGAGASEGASACTEYLLDSDEEEEDLGEDSAEEMEDAEVGNQVQPDEDDVEESDEEGGSGDEEDDYGYGDLEDQGEDPEGEVEEEGGEEDLGPEDGEDELEDEYGNEGFAKL